MCYHLILDYKKKKGLGGEVLLHCVMDRCCKNNYDDDDNDNNNNNNDLQYKWRVISPSFHNE